MQFMYFDLSIYSDSITRNINTMEFKIQTRVHFLKYERRGGIISQRRRLLVYIDLSPYFF